MSGQQHPFLHKLYGEIVEQENLLGYSIKPNAVGYLFEKQRSREYLDFQAGFEALPKGVQTRLYPRVWDAVEATAVVGAKEYTRTPGQHIERVRVSELLKRHKVKEYYELMRVYSTLKDPKKPGELSRHQLLINTPMWRLLQRSCEFGFHEVKRMQQA